jgi:hypothetical protein
MAIARVVTVLVGQDPVIVDASLVEFCEERPKPLRVFIKYSQALLTTYIVIVHANDPL